MKNKGFTLYKQHQMSPYKYRIDEKISIFFHFILNDPRIGVPNGGSTGYVFDVTNLQSCAIMKKKWE